MPFVPLGSRKRIEVILDDDKSRLSNEMKAKDNATVKLHHQVMPGASGYRYANHPLTMGPVRGPAAPFQGSNKPWAPPEDDPCGMASMKDLEHAPVGAYNTGSHAPIGETLRKTRSTPALVRTLKANPVEEGGKSLGEQAKEKANPISIELTRWQRLAEVTKRDQVTMPPLNTKYRDIPPPKKHYPSANGLTNFPKYMLFENSHMKHQDLIRFIEAENQARDEAQAKHQRKEERTMRGEPPDTPLSTSREDEDELVPFATASWGQPRLRGPQGTVKKQWAGSAMPSGKSQRSSNWFRTG